MFRNALVLAFAATVAAGGCGQTENGPAADAAKAALEEIVRKVATAVPAEPAGDTLWYRPDTLFEYIDGDAGRFIDAGFLWVVHTEWRPRGAAGKAYVELDIYDMGSPLGALDVFADSRSDQVPHLALGNEALGTDELLEIRLGRYYVKLVPRHDPSQMRSLMRTLADAVIAAAPAGPGDEQLISPLPTERLVPHSANFTTRGFLGRDFLCNVREAAYETGGKRVRLFVMDAQSPDKAKAALREWKESVPAQSTSPRNLPNVFESTEVYVGTVTVAQKDRYLAGAIGEPESARPMLESLLRRLE